jgi:starch phosphorylase
LPAAAAFQERSLEDGKMAADLIQWTREVGLHWPAVRFGSLTVVEKDEDYVFAVQVYLDELDPDTVSVELYAYTEKELFRRIMDRGQPLVGAHGYVYSARVSAARSANNYTPRVVPSRPGAAVPLEANQILWQR